MPSVQSIASFLAASQGKEFNNSHITGCSLFVQGCTFVGWTHGWAGNSAEASEIQQIGSTCRRIIEILIQFHFAPKQRRKTLLLSTAFCRRGANPSLIVNKRPNNSCEGACVTLPFIRSCHQEYVEEMWCLSKSHLACHALFRRPNFLKVQVTYDAGDRKFSNHWVSSEIQRNSHLVLAEWMCLKLPSKSHLKLQCSPFLI